MLPQTQPGPVSQAMNCGASGIAWDQRWVTVVLLPGTVATACRKLTFQYWRCNSPKLWPGPQRGSHWFSSDQVSPSGLRDWAIWKPSPHTGTARAQVGVGAGEEGRLGSLGGDEMVL